VKADKFVVKLKRHSSSYETDQGEQPRKVFIDQKVFIVALEQLYNNGIKCRTLCHGRPQKFFQVWGNVQILLILFKLLTMQCKWRFTKRLTFLTHYSVLVESHLSIFYLNLLSTNTSKYKINHRLEQRKRWKNEKVSHSRKTVSSIENGTICWQDYRTTY